MELEAEYESKDAPGHELLPLINGGWPIGVMACDFRWYDIGTWPSLYRALQDSQGTKLITSGAHIDLESDGGLVVIFGGERANQRLGALGLRSGTGIEEDLCRVARDDDAVVYGGLEIVLELRGLEPLGPLRAELIAAMEQAYGESGAYTPRRPRGRVANGRPPAGRLGRARRDARPWLRGASRAG